jgi:hypothetical protein
LSLLLGLRRSKATQGLQAVLFLAAAVIGLIRLVGSFR